ncbi:MAG: tetratricopeptide repeat protein [Chlorobiaceae bacterium]|nr:tetratricopeptide repeat protein [Chlorobiaceae bacterium]
MMHNPKTYRRLAASLRPLLILFCLSGLLACQNKAARIKELQQEVWKNPQDARGYMNLGKEYARLQRYDEAIRSYERAIGIEPGLDEAYSALGAAYFDKKEFSSALHWMQKRVALAPDDSLRLFDLGNVYFQLKQYNDAQASYQKAIDNSYSFQEAWYSMAVCFIKTGKIDEARKILKWLQNKNNYLAVSLERHLQDDVPEKTGK